jgi:hypothetical protein
MRARGATAVEVREEAQAAFNTELDAAMTGTVWTAGRCHSWYLDQTGRNTTLWPGWSFRFRSRTRRFEPEKFRLARAPALVPVHQGKPATRAWEGAAGARGEVSEARREAGP